MFHNFSDSAAPAGAAESGVRGLARALIPRDDHVRLTSIASAAAETDDPNGLRLLAKVRAAEICEPGDLPRGVVAMKDFVTYRTDSGKPHTRALIYPDDGMWPPAEVSVLTPLGTALIGQREGERVFVEGNPESWSLAVLIEKTGFRRMTGGLVRVAARESRNTAPEHPGSGGRAVPERDHEQS